MFKFFFVATLVPAMTIADVNFRACPNGAPTPATLAVNNCTGNECFLVTGEPLNAQASGIVTLVGSNSATVDIVARADGFEIPIAATGEVVGGYRIVAGIPFDYAVVKNSLTFPFRNIPGEVEVSLVGDGGVTLACVRFDAIIQ